MIYKTAYAPEFRSFMLQNPGAARLFLDRKEFVKDVYPHRFTLSRKDVGRMFIAKIIPPDNWKGQRYCAWKVCFQGRTLFVKEVQAEQYGEGRSGMEQHDLLTFMSAYDTAHIKAAAPHFAFQNEQTSFLVLPYFNLKMAWESGLPNYLRQEFREYIDCMKLYGITDLEYNSFYETRTRIIYVVDPYFNQELLIKSQAGKEASGREGIRTPGLVVANDALYR